jgi:DNA invertase Pin-like site-specific DNA recombinase
MKRAVLYLRVSTTSQVKTDYDPEGISIPAQRAACQRKAKQMGATVVDEYIEPGVTATSMDKRVAFQKTLERIRTARDVDAVIIYKLSRLNRKWEDNAIVATALQRQHVALVSATENIDETPEGMMLMGVLASINAHQSAASGADIRYKMGEKARRGGTLGRAPLGYRNVRDFSEGCNIAILVPDPERAEFVTLGFTLYATGEYTLDELSDELADRGLISKPGKHGSRQVSGSRLQTMLRESLLPRLCLLQRRRVPWTARATSDRGAIRTGANGHGQSKWCWRAPATAPPLLEGKPVVWRMP